MAGEEIKFEKENLVARVDADSTKQDTSLSSLESYYLHEVRKQTMSSSNDRRDMVHAYETYKDLEFILEVLKTATKDNISRNGKCKINSFSYFIPILEDRLNEKNKEVKKVESVRNNSEKSPEYDLSGFMWTGEN